MLIDPVDPERAVREWVSIAEQHERQIDGLIAKAAMRAWRRAGAGVNRQRYESELRATIETILAAHYRRVMRSILTWTFVHRKPPADVGTKAEEGEQQEPPSQSMPWTAAQAARYAALVARILQQSVDWVRQRAYEQSVVVARTIARRVQRYIRTVFREAIERQLTMPEAQAGREIEASLTQEMIDKLSPRVQKNLAAYARLVARMETMGAADEAGARALERHKREYGVRTMGSQWITAGDERVRSGHRTVRAVAGDELDRDPFDEPDGFTPPSIEEDNPQFQSWPKIRAGGSFLLEGRVRASRPRDPAILAQGAPHLLYNCRCVLTYVTDPGARLRRRQAG